ncbi:major facilitator superfamily domain-containing protein [Lophiotrema nucula]|uniref:Major facilitator superfamily domain-containing protein n=1 Tax=Lophiotrema nucula TaxID=690887 RepID=A0A6A5ZEL3_9PLEO|nr:major facilitator superfamily domain-containing protein [Lophiotrema nucula]
MATQSDDKNSETRIESIHAQPEVLPLEIEAVLDVEEIHLGWRTWLVVFVAGFFAIFTQIFTSVAAPSTIAFIVQDLGQPGISGWVIQAPLLVQAALNPILGRLSDVVDRKMLVVIPPLFAAAGSFIGAKATDMNMLIAGSVLTGITLATNGVVTTIPAEILPLKYRSIANGIGFLGGSCGGLLGGFLGGVFCRTPEGWRNMLWAQGALHVACSISLFVCYWPRKRPEVERRRLKGLVWACDPIGCFFFIGGATLLLISLDWSSGSYPWRSTHVAVPFSLGLLFLILFGLYEWKGRSDGICAHVFFQAGRNFPLSLFALAVEGWMYFSAVNTVTTQMTFYLEWDTDPLRISIRQLAYFGPTVFTSLVVMWYSTRYKDVRTPLVVCFVLFLAVSCAYIGTKPHWGAIQYGLNVLAGIGQAGPLTLLLVVTQFTAPHAYLSTATGLAFSFRAIGGAFGSAVLYSIINGHVSSHYNSAVAKASVASGLSPDAVTPLLSVMREGNGPPTKAALLAVLSQVIPGINSTIITSAVDAGHEVYARGYQLAWASIVPFVVVAIVCCALLTDVKKLMTEKVEATMEKLPEKVVS